MDTHGEKDIQQTPPQENPQNEKLGLKPILEKTILKFMTTSNHEVGRIKTYRLQDAVNETYGEIVKQNPRLTHLSLHNKLISNYPDFDLQSLEHVEGYDDDDLTYDQFCGRANLFIIQNALKLRENFQTENLFDQFNREVAHREAKYKLEVEDLE